MINKINVDGVDHEIISESAEKKIAENKKKLDTLVINDLTTGGSNKALSAEMGVELNNRTTELEKQINGAENVTDSSSITSPSWTKKSLSKIIPKGSKIISIEGSFTGTGYLLGGADSSESITISIDTLPIEVPFNITMFTCSPTSTTIVFNFTGESVKGIIATLDTLADKTYVDTAIATAITTTLNTEV